MSERVSVNFADLGRPPVRSDPRPVVGGERPAPTPAPMPAPATVEPPPPAPVRVSVNAAAPFTSPPQGAPEASPAALLESLAFRSTDALGRAIPAYMATPSDQVVLDGVPTTVSVAVTLGILRPDPEGGFKLTPKGEAEMAQRQQRAVALAQEQGANEAAFARATALPAEAVQLPPRCSGRCPPTCRPACWPS